MYMKKNKNEFDETNEIMSYFVFDNDGVFDETNSSFTLDEYIILRDLFEDNYYDDGILFSSLDERLSHRSLFI